MSSYGLGPFASAGESNPKKRGRSGGPTGLYRPEDESNKRFSRQDINFNSRWKRLSIVKIKQALEFYDSDKFVQDAVAMKLNHILGGGIFFKRQLMKMDEQAERWHSTTYTSWLRQAYRYLMACGFAARSHIPHPDYIGEPVLLDISRVETYILSDVWGRVSFKFFLNQDDAPPGDPEGNLEIPNVTVISMNLPSADGSIKSIADVLMPDWRVEEKLQQYMILACKLKCFPPIVTQMASDKTQSQNMYSSFGLQPRESDDSDTMQRQLASYASGAYAQFIKSAMQQQNGPPLSMEAQENSTHRMLYSNQVFLDVDRQVAKIDMAHEPDKYIEFSQKRRDDVFAFFSIPPGVVAAGGAASHRSSTSSSSVNAMTVFINDQKQLKNRFLCMVQDTISEIADHVNIIETIVNTTRKKQRKSFDQVKAESHITVEMPGLPEDHIIMTLYLTGALKYETMCATMAAKYGLSKEAFNPKPMIEVDALNGIKPEPPQTDIAKSQ